MRPRPHSTRLRYCAKRPGDNANDARGIANREHRTVPYSDHQQPASPCITIIHAFHTTAHPPLAASVPPLVDRLRRQEADASDARREPVPLDHPRTPQARHCPTPLRCTANSSARQRAPSGQSRWARSWRPPVRRTRSGRHSPANAMPLERPRGADHRQLRASRHRPASLPAHDRTQAASPHSRTGAKPRTRSRTNDSQRANPGKHPHRRHPHRRRSAAEPRSLRRRDQRDPQRTEQPRTGRLMRKPTHRGIR